MYFHYFCHRTRALIKVTIITRATSTNALSGKVLSNCWLNVSNVIIIKYRQDNRYPFSSASTCAENDVQIIIATILDRHSLDDWLATTCVLAPKIIVAVFHERK